jgi:hypothetical protein
MDFPRLTDEFWHSATLKQGSETLLDELPTLILDFPLSWEMSQILQTKAWNSNCSNSNR